MIETTTSHARLHTLLERLVRLYSPSGKEEKIQRYLHTYLHSHGLPVQRDEVTPGRYNLYMWEGTTAPEIVFIGHVDTVPAYDSDAYEPVCVDGRMHGLGTADMKGGCAAMIEACVRYREVTGAIPPVGMALVVGEEEWGDGATHMLKRYCPSYVLIGEPTDVAPCATHFGYVLLTLHVSGTRRHASFSGREYNAVYSLLRALIQLAETVEETYPGAILNIRDVHSAESGFAVPDRCEASVDIHFPPTEDFPACVAAVQKGVSDSLGDASVQFECEIELAAPGFAVPDDSVPFAHLRDIFVKKNLPWLPQAFQSHSDAVLFHDAGCIPIMLGPGSLSQAHTNEESIPLSEVYTVADIYYEFMLRCGGHL